MQRMEQEQKEVAQFEVGELLPIGFTIIVLAIGLAYGLNVMSDVKSDFTDTTSAEYNATVDGINAVAKIPQKLGLIVTVILAAVVIGILVTYLYKRVVG